MCSVVRGDAGETAAAGARCPEAKADVHTIAIDLSLNRRHMHLDTIKSALQLFIKLNVRLSLLPESITRFYSRSVTVLLICMQSGAASTSRKIQFSLV